MVPEVGFEPTRPEGLRILSPPRLPFRHSGTLRKVIHRANEKYSAKLSSCGDILLFMDDTYSTYGETSSEQHLQNIAANLALIADLGYASVSLIVREGDQLRVMDAVRTTAAIGPEIVHLVGATVTEPHPLIQQALSTGRPAESSTIEDRDGIQFVTSAQPVMAGSTPIGVLLRETALSAHEAPGRMEQEFMAIVNHLVELICTQPLLTRAGKPFATTRRPGDGVMHVDRSGIVLYPSPNAVAIMRRAGYEQRVRTSRASELPGGGYAIVPILGTTQCLEYEADVLGRTLLYRAVGLGAQHGALVLVEDRTEAKRQELALQVKDATIREVHHRVKNNLQTVASLLRMQMRRVSSGEAKDALQESMDRVSSMAAVHELLANTDGEMLDFLDVTRAVAEPIKRGYVGATDEVTISVSGQANILLAAPIATSLAMVLTELLHNSFEHGIDTLPEKRGTIEIDFERTYSSDGVRMLRLRVTDPGPGLPTGFSIDASESLGLSIINTVVSQDLQGSIQFSHENGRAAVEVVFPEDLRTKQY